MPNPQTMTNHQLYLRLMGYLTSYRIKFVLVLLGTTVVAITDSAIPLSIKPMLDSIFISKTYDSIQLIPLIFIVLFLIRSLSSFISNYGINWIGRIFTVDLQTKIFDKYLMLPTHCYENQTNESLALKLTSDLTQITKDGTKALITFGKNILTISVLLIWIFYLNWELSLLIILITPIILLSTQLIYDQPKGIGEKVHKTTENFNQIIKESTKNHKAVILNGGQKHILNRFHDEANRIQQLDIKDTNIFRIPLIHIVIAIALSTIFYLAIQQTFTDGTTIGSFVSFITSILVLFLSLQQLIKAKKLLQSSLAIARSIFTFLDLEIELDTGKITLDHVQGELKFEHVSFFSDLREKTLLNDFSFTIRPGEKIALVGISDDTKNVFMNLVPRFIHPSNGKIFLDAHELADIKLASLRSKIGLLSQETILSNDSVAANIAYGEMGYSTENEIISAAHAAHAIEFIRKMPQGMQTLIGEHGIKLSREQYQHIAIARALLKDPPILIIDEITTILNPESESLMQSALINLMKNRTSIIIACRKVTLEKVDRIIVIEHNHIKKIGSHQELFSEEGYYRKLYSYYH